MIKTVDRYLIRQLLFASFVAAVVFSGPPILISLFVHLPEGYIYTELLWPALSAIAPSILYHILPLLVAGSIIWCYGKFSSDGTLLTLQLAGQSIFRTRAPALYVALAATIIGYAMSCYVAPLTAGNLHDALNFVRHDVYPPMLNVGRANELEGGRLTIIFKKFLKRNEIAGVFIRKVDDDNVETAYYAQRAVFERSPEQSHIVLFDGAYQEFKPARGEVKTTNFDQLVAPLRSFGINATKRGVPLTDELSTTTILGDLWRARGGGISDGTSRRLWTRELIERFSIPALTVIHTLLGLGLLALWGVLSDRRNQPIVVICGVIGSFHLVQIIGTELIGMDLGWVWLTAGIACIELTAAVALMSLQPEQVTRLAASAATRARDGIRAGAAAATARVQAELLKLRMFAGASPLRSIAATYSDARRAPAATERQLSGSVAD